MRILVAGGAGYIGSHMVKLLVGEGHQVVTLDNLSNGFRDAVLAGELIQADLCDRDQLEKVFGKFHFDGVMHFASLIQVGESVAHPDRYYRNNVTGSINLFDAMLTHDVKHLIFSSSAAIFGEPITIPIKETDQRRPLNPYGQSKLIVEQILADYDRSFGLKSVSLRYFNAAGADPDGELGERHDPETHLIPLVLQTASGRRDKITVFGRDYDTPDGTCIRDYIHIVDLCQAHLLALELLRSGHESAAYNLGNGHGFSVHEVTETAKEVTRRNIKAVDGPRREGDPARLVADSSLAREVLGWKPRYERLQEIIEHAWKWELKMAEKEKSRIE